MEEKHTVLSNINYVFWDIWKWDKAFYFYFILGIPLAVLLPFMSTYFSKLLIEVIERNRGFKIVILTILIYSAALLCIGLLNGFCQSRLAMRRYIMSKGV